MNTIKAGSNVTVTFAIRSPAGEIIEYNDTPANYVHGGVSELFPAIEKALDGKKVGDEVKVGIRAEEAFGLHDPSLTFTDDIINAPLEMRFVGAEFAAESASGEALDFRVTKVANGKITIDANHVLAGRDLVFHVTVKEVV